jgi:hypothetical protein
MNRLTDKSFQYTPSFDTNLKKKFAQIIRQQRAAERRSHSAEARLEHSVLPMMARRTGTGTKS